MIPLARLPEGIDQRIVFLPSPDAMLEKERGPRWLVLDRSHDAIMEKELKRREGAYRDNLPGIEIKEKTIIIADDGLATGATMLAAVAALRKRGPAAIVVAVPAGAPDACDILAREADEVVCAVAPEPFHAVGAWYDDFAQTSDEEVRELLKKARVPK